MRPASRHAWLLALLLVGLTLPGVALAAPGGRDDARFFVQTGYRVADDAFWDYFSHRGGVRSFGYPVSRRFVLEGFPVQVFQRAVLQQAADGSVRPLNLLDPELLPYTAINFSQFPAADRALKAATPRVDAPDYAARVLEFVRSTAPETWNDLPVRFFSTFSSTVTCQDAFPAGGCQEGLLPLLDLELWGAPISAPAYDPHNRGFVYQRFQRGILHYDAGCGCTQGILLADYFKGLLTGQGLPADLAAEAQGSRYFGQYAPAAPAGVARPDQLPASDLRLAFSPDTAAAADDRFGVVVTGLTDVQLTAETVAPLLQGVGASWWYTYGSAPLAIPGAHRLELVTTGERWTEPNPEQLKARAVANPGALWLIGNEPNVPAQDHATPAQYAMQLQTMVGLIKGIDPTARIAGPNVLNWDRTCVDCTGITAGHDWTQQFLQAYRDAYGQEPPIDVWGIHAYAIDWSHLPMVETIGPEADLTAFRAFLDAQPGQAGKPIWLTEFGVVWAFEGYQKQKLDDGRTVVVPSGRYRDDLVSDYLRRFGAWLSGPGANLGIERWFVYASYGPPEPYATASAVLSLYHGPTADSGLTGVGETYRNLTVGTAP